MDVKKMKPENMQFVYVCSRYRGNSLREIFANIDLTLYACRQVIEMGAIPIAPHLYFPRFLDDNNDVERRLGMEAGKRLMKVCKSFYVLTVDQKVSEGMREELDYMTKTLGLEGFYKDLTRQEAEGITKKTER